MTDTHRSITVDRLAQGVYRARSARGAELTFGPGTEDGFSPVELLMVALAGCSAIDVDVVTSRRAEPEAFVVRVDAEKVREEGANLLRDLTLTFELAFADDEAGRAAASTVERAVAVSHDRSCTVSRTLEAGLPVTVRIA